MLHFLTKVTGIPPTEARSLASLGSEYRRYQETTPKYVPRFGRGRKRATPAVPAA